MKVQILSQFYPPEMEPSGFMFAALAQHISREHYCEVISGFANFPSGRFINRGSFEFIRCELDGRLLHKSVIVMPSDNKNNFKRIINYLSFMFSSMVFGVFSKKSDVIIATSPPIFTAISALITSKLKRSKFILDIRDIWPESAIQMGNLRNPVIIALFNYIELLLYRNADVIVTATPGMMSEIKKKLGLVTKTISCIPCGVHVYSDLELEVYRGRSTLVNDNSDEGKFVVLYGGLHGLAQGLEAIIDAAALLAHLPNIVFYFVGDGPEKGKLVEYTHRLGIGNIKFFDPINRDDIRSLYTKVGCALVPLRNLRVFDNVYPSKTFELFSFGVPVVVGVNGEIADLVLKNKAALTVEPENSSAYASAILRYYENDEFRSDTSTRAREFVSAEFDYNVLNSNYMKLINSLLH